MIEANIPIIDLAPFGNPAADTKETARMIREACKHFGFFYVKNHGVPQTLIESIFQNSKQFFSLSRE